jgi:hypothetical protein
MFRRLLIGALLAAGVAGPALAATCATYPNVLTNGTTADANQVMANFNCAALTGNGLFTGNVGIGTTVPSALLDLGTAISTIKLSVYDQSGANAYGVGVNAGELTFGAGLSSLNAGLQMVLTNTGLVGIGNSAPNALLDLGSQITTIKLAIFEVNNSTFYGLGVANGQMTFGAAIASPTSTPQAVLTSAGYFGIGTTSPSYPLYVNGTAYATGAAGALSDIRHKDNVKTLGAGGLGVVEKLRPVTFAWKHPTDDGMKGEQIGFIAQEVQKVLPSVVLTENNAERTLGIKYTELIPVLAEAIQEQQAEIEQLRAELAAMKGAR